MKFFMLIKPLLWMKTILVLVALNMPVSGVLAVGSWSTVSQPEIDFSATGGYIAVLGNFDGLSFYKSQNESQFLLPAEPNTSALYLRNETSGGISKIASVEGGQVTSLQRLGGDTVLVEGNFSMINNQRFVSPVILNITSQELTPIIPQPQNSQRKRDDSFSGLIRTTFVDDDLIYLGGAFEFNGTHGVAVYNITDRSLSSVPFKGFGVNSSVNAIAKYPPDIKEGSIIFGGSFDTLGLPELLLHNVSFPAHNISNSTNTSLISAEQVISLKHASFTNVNGLFSNDDTAVICPRAASTWALQDNSGGEWNVQLPLEVRGITPTKVRIYVPEESVDGIKDFRIYTFPNNGIMNLTYIDPSTNRIAFCDANCPLQLGSALKKSVESNIKNADSYADDNSVFIDENGSFSSYFDPSTRSKNLGYGSNYQEFSFVNNVMIDALTLTTISWYGSKGMFSGFEIYSDSISVYGNEILNESNCGDESMQDSNSAVINNGDWVSIHSLSSLVTNTEYLVSVVDGSSAITLYPNISYAGNYSLLFYTPGCSVDNSCMNRSRVNVTVIGCDDQILSSNIIYQNNLQDKFDYLYYGHLNGSSTSEGRNRVQIGFESIIDSSANSPWVVVDRVVAHIVSLDEPVFSNSTNSTQNFTDFTITSMPLHGLFEYSLANFTSFSEDLVFEKSINGTVIKNTNTFVGNSTINVLSANLSDTSFISNILYSPSSKSILLNGEFTSSNASLSNNNLLSISVDGYNSTANNIEVSSIHKRHTKREDQTILGATFNNSITNIYNVNDGVVALGKFSLTEGNGIKNLATGNTSTSSANNFAFFKTGEWYSFDNNYISTDFSLFTSIVLSDTEFYVFSALDGTYRIWDNTGKEWSNNKAVLDITSAVMLDDAQQVIGGSSFGIMGFYSNDQGGFSNTNEFFSLNTGITTGSVLTSYYLNSSLSVIGGSFRTNTSIENVALVSKDTTFPLGDLVRWSNYSAVTAAYVNSDENLLFLGTNGSVILDESSVAGLLVYNMNSHSFQAIQPPDISTSDGTSMAVNALALYDQSSQLLVGGNFAFAGSLGCQTVCLYDIMNTRWINPSPGSLSAQIGGVVTDARFFAPDAVLLSGNLTLNNTKSNFAVYDFSNNAFEAVETGFNDIGVSGFITKYIINDNADGKLSIRMTAIGSDFVIGYTGSAWSRIDDGIQITEATRFTDLKLINLSSRNSNNSHQTYFNNNQALFLSGSFNLTGYGLVSVALFDGSSWSPYIFSSRESAPGQVNSLLLADIYKSHSSSDLKQNKKQLSTGKIVGISLACALGSTAFLGLLYAIPFFFIARDTKKKQSIDQRIHEDEMMDIVNPEDLFQEMDAQRTY